MSDTADESKWVPIEETPSQFSHGIVYEIDADGRFSTMEVNGVPVECPTKSLWDHMLPALHSFHKALHRSVCSGSVEHSISFRWFCDTPTARMEMVMVVERTPTGAQYHSCTLGSTPHDASIFACGEFTDPQTPSWVQCCQCLCFQSGEEWLTPEDFCKAHAEELQAGSCPISHTLCDGCITQYAVQSKEMREILREANIPIPEAAPAKVVCEALVVDANPVTARIISALLSALHCSVDVETSSVNALECVCGGTRGPFGLIVIDSAMPEMGGAELIRTLRELSCSAFIIGISRTTKAQEELVSAGADLFLCKPIRQRALSEALKAAAPRLLRKDRTPMWTPAFG